MSMDAVAPPRAEMSATPEGVSLPMRKQPTKRAGFGRQSSLERMGWRDESPGNFKAQSFDINGMTVSPEFVPRKVAETRHEIQEEADLLE
jgi:hypothetical protein